MSELEDFKAKLLVKAAELRDQHGWGREINAALQELELPELPTRKTYTFEVDVDTPAATSVATYSVTAYTDDDASARVTALVDADRESKRVFNGRMTTNHRPEQIIGANVRLTTQS